MLYTMVGLPASGKSTFTNNHKECVIVSTDEIRTELFGSAEEQKDSNKVFTIAFNRIRKAIDDNKDVIFDATNVTKKNRKNVLRRFKNVEHVAVFLNINKEICKERNSKRERKVPEFVIDRMAEKLEIPTIAEGFNKVLVF